MCRVLFVLKSGAKLRTFPHVGNPQCEVFVYHEEGRSEKMKSEKLATATVSKSL